MLRPQSKNAILRSCAGIAACDDLMKNKERIFVQLGHLGIMQKQSKLMVLFY